MPRISNTQAYVVACTGGAILWQATALLTGRREAWDSDAYLSVSYPLGILLTGALGYLNPVRPWRWGLALTLIQPVVMVVRPDHPLLAERRFALTMIERYQTLMPTPSSLIRRLVDRMLLTHGITELRDEVETVSDAFGRAYISQTDAVWIISEGVVANDVAAGKLALLPVDTSETTGPVGFTTRTDMAPAMATSSLIQAVREVAAGVG